MATVATQSRSQNGSSGNRGRRTNNRGRGGKGRGAQPAPASNAPPAVIETAKAGVADERAASVDDDMVCWICAEQVKYFAVSECNHRTCHVCALRLRALYKKMECTFCKVNIYTHTHLTDTDVDSRKPKGSQSLRRPPTSCSPTTRPRIYRTRTPN